MRVMKAVPPTEVDHIIQPLVRDWLKDYDYVLVFPNMGLSQFKEFGERVIVDCHDYINHRIEWEQQIRQLAAKYSLSTLDNPCGTSKQTENEDNEC